MNGKETPLWETVTNWLLVLPFAILKLGLGIFSGCMVRGLHAPTPVKIEVDGNLMTKNDLIDWIEF